MNKTVLMCCATLLAGCVGHYQQPAEVAPHATLDARWGDNDLMSGGFQGYWIYNDAHCQKSANSGVLGEISQSDTAQNRFLIEPDKRVFLNALSSGIKQRETGERLTSKSCINIVSFVPEAGVTYQITHSAPKSGCTLKLVDLNTGNPPKSLIIEPVTKECGF